MTDLELAEEIERRVLGKWSVKPTIYFDEIGWREIIAALRRGPERPPSGEMVMVPREDLIRWACWLEEADSSLGPYWLGAKRDKAFKEAADEIRSRLAGTFSCPHCGISTPHQHSIDRKGNVILSAAEAEGRKT